MSGDVQPRKRKDKKRKKVSLIPDELTLEESRGTSATFGEGDVFIHSQHDHGTGGHWCAKIIFFSLLAILVALIGLIILENRGLSELEANAVESRYGGVLEGWLEEVTDDDHHDVHTLELNHPDEDDHDEEEQDENHDEVEHIEEEPVDEEPISIELPALPEENDDDDDDKNPEEAKEKDDGSIENEDDDFLEHEDIDDDVVPPIIEHVTAPAGKPFREVEDSNEVLPIDTLAEEEEYEKQQEELRREEAEASHQDGGNSVDDTWAGEPSDEFWIQELDQAEDHLYKPYLN